MLTYMNRDALGNQIPLFQILLKLSLIVIAASGVSATTAADCPVQDGITLQVLGSGGPIADDGRAGSSYIVWVDGRSRVLIDAGSGAFLRFAESGADFADLDFVGLSHFHVDHTADFAALLKSASFSDRTRALIVSGPSKSDQFPGLRQFMTRLLDPERGLYGYLGAYLDGSRGFPKLALLEIHEGYAGPVRVLGDSDGEYEILALQVSHGVVPALAFRVRIGPTLLVFAGDQDGQSGELDEFASGADALVLHMPIPETATGIASRLHARPSALGQLAESASAKFVIVSHLMQRSTVDLDANLRSLKSRYNGKVQVASDLACYTINRE